MTEPDKRLTPEEIIDSTRLQIFSLRAFMQALDYQWAADTALFDEPLYFESYAHKNKARKKISFQTAVNLYNNAHADNHGGWAFNPPFDFDKYSLKKAQAAKVVQQVKLILNKKTGYIKTQNHIVKFVDPIYYEMFKDSTKYFPF
jgi:S1-C subfamily serine protease